MLCPRCRQDNPPAARFCLECGARLGIRCPGCEAEVPDGARFCPQCGKAIDTARPAAPAAYTPSHLAQRILTSRAALEGERKQITVLFADIKGSMELLSSRDPEEARTILDPLLERMIEAVHHYEGTVNQVMGDGLMALFGAPLAHEDHAVRACYAALRMQGALQRHAESAARAVRIPVQLRIGLNSGDVVVRSIASDLRMDYSAVGQTTHLAARMEQLASPGSILITASTARLVEGHVEARPLGPMAVKGMSHPVVVYELIGPGPMRARLDVAAARGLTPFVGREAQLELLRAVIARAATGQGQVVAMVGEAGVGKSRLLAELLRSDLPDGWRALRSRSVSYGKSTAYSSVIDLLRNYFDLADDDDPSRIAEKVRGRLRALDPALEPNVSAILHLLAVPLDDTQWDLLDPRDRRRRTADAVRALLVRESVAQPLLIVFEDLHWIDDGTQECLDALVDAVPAARALLLVNYRPEYQHGWGIKSYYTQIPVAPLPRAGAEELLDSILGLEPALDSLKTALIERTEGNPFFLEENVRALIETGVLGGEPGAYRLAQPLAELNVPPSVQAVLAARIDRLAPDDKRLLQAAAVIGKDVRLAVLREVSDLPEEELRPALARLQAAEFLLETRLFPEVELAFKHALTHEVAYGGLLTDRRRELHGRTFAALERLHAGRLADAAEILAHHAVRAEAWAPAIDHLRAAATRAYERGSIAETLERLELALTLGGRLPQTPDNARRILDVRLDLHAPLIMLGDTRRLTALHDETSGLVRALGDRVRLARTLYRVSAARWLAARYEEGLAAAREAVAQGQDDPESRIFGTLYVGLHSLFLGRIPDAIDHFLRIVEGPDAELSQRRFGASTPAYVVAHNFLLWALVSIGEFERALEHGRRSVALCDASGAPTYRVTTYALFTVALAYRGEFAEAVRLAEEAVRTAESNMVLAWLPGSYSALGWVLAWTGRTEEALPYLERSVSVHETLGINAYLSVFCCRLAEALRLAGRAAEAAPVAARALDLARRFGERGIESEILLALGEIDEALAPEDVDRADARYRQAIEIGEALGLRPVLARAHLRRGQFRLRIGDEAAARGDLATATRMFREMDMRFWLGRAEGGVTPAS
jgi:class 3 adenylate cyclase/tetratricopeptide (TPR) repeat protein